MTLRHGKIIVHRADPNSETDASTSSSDDAEVAEIAEYADLRYSKKQVPSRNHHKKTEQRQKRLNMATQHKNLTADSRRSSSSSLSSQEFPILRLLAPDRSGPLHRSHYTTVVRNQVGSKELTEFPNERRSSISSSEDGNTQNKNAIKERLGFRALASGQNASSIARNPIRHHRIVRTQSIPDVKSTFASAMVPIGLCEFIGDEVADSTIGGLSKLLKNLNIAERRRQQKAEQDRVNIYKLTPQMKKQLKNIYVY